VTNRPANKNTAKRWPRDPYDWYKEPRATNRQLFDTMAAHCPLGQPGALDLVWDPCCGSGWVLDEAKERGHPTIGSDVVDRKARHRFVRGNILLTRNPPKPPAGRSLSIVTNPPYSYEEDIAEKVIRKCLTFPVRRAAFILPIAFLAGQNRYRFFSRDLRPSHVIIYSQRHTMPPGAYIDEMASPFEGGMQDYCALVYTGPTHQWRSEIIWARPDSL